MEHQTHAHVATRRRALGPGTLTKPKIACDNMMAVGANARIALLLAAVTGASAFAGGTPGPAQPHLGGGLLGGGRLGGGLSFTPGSPEHTARLQNFKHWQHERAAHGPALKLASSEITKNNEESSALLELAATYDKASWANISHVSYMSTSPAWHRLAAYLSTDSTAAFLRQTVREHLNRIDALNAEVQALMPANSTRPRPHYGLHEYCDRPVSQQPGLGGLNPNPASTGRRLQQSGAVSTAACKGLLSQYGDTLSWATASNPKGEVCTTPVKNQNPCNNCWALSATEQVESAIKIGGGPLQTLSEQAPWQCTGDLTSRISSVQNQYEKPPCSAFGLPLNAWAYMSSVHSGGVGLDQDYPYDVGSKSCEYAPGAGSGIDLSKTTPSNGYSPVATTGQASIISGCSTTPLNGGNRCLGATVTAMCNAIQEGPFVVFIDSNTMRSAMGGVVHASSSCGSDQNHYVQVVGFTTSTTKCASDGGCWIVRNSWGTSSANGDNGYWYFPADADTCGIARFPQKVSVSPS